MLDTATTVTARLNYLDPGEHAPRSYIDPPATGAAVRRPETVVEEVVIQDVRPILEKIALDREGMALVHRLSQVRNFYDADEVRSVYYPEVRELVEEVTGAARVHVFDHNVRSEPRADRGEAKVRKPVRFVHNDYTETSGPQRVRDLLPDEAEALLGRRFAVINVWRPIVGPVEDTPLAVCDATSMGDGDFVATDLVYEDRVGEVYSVRYRPTHRWYYVSAMQPDEAMLLKCYDSETDGRARFTAHSAFHNPTAPADVIPRESIEARTLAFF
ncbi:MAG: CmcJ/NvfI family oxidoreductase [Alphaproteobacteria bacterium]|jgi:hypothetical protein|nr:CmcJ/NvfI family oxidoreductase [Alphaproteobacteria bacterium]